MNVNIHELQAAFDLIDKINSVPLDSIKWMRNGVELTPNADDIKDWKYTGLTNCYFYRLQIQEEK